MKTAWRLFSLLLVSSCLAAPLAADSLYGRLSGIVVDPGGVPQMGASVAVAPQAAVDRRSPLQLLTNERGRFTAERLLPGIYSVKVTLAGFLPVIERNVRVDADLTTLLKVELNSVFATFERLRGRPGQTPEPDDWAWVLRASAATRPVLRWVDGQVVLDGEVTDAGRSWKNRPHGRVEFTSGARRRGSPSNMVDAPSTAFAYEQKVKAASLMLAGQVSYERAAAAGFATMWLPTGKPGHGPQSTLVLRQSRLGPGGHVFRGARVEHVSQWQFSEQLGLRYGAEVLYASLGGVTTSLRPRAELSYQVGPAWRASLIVASRPWADANQPQNPLQAVTEQLDAFPAVMLRRGRPVIEGGWHEEVAVQHRLGPNMGLLAAVFRDRSRHTAVFGRGPASGEDFLQDFFSHGFVYDGGEMNSWGTRVALRRSFSDELEATVIYAWAGALGPEEVVEAVGLRDALDVHYRHSLAARVKTIVPRWGTQVLVSYKWISGPVVSRLDAYGEAANQVDPYLNLVVRQPLPALFASGRFEALADFRNLLAQGYVPMAAKDGQIVLVPAFRTFRGGFSFQF